MMGVLFCDKYEPPYDAIQNHDFPFMVDDVNNCFCWSCLSCLDIQIDQRNHLKCHICERSREKIVNIHILMNKLDGF